MSDRESDEERPEPIQGYEDDDSRHGEAQDDDSEVDFPQPNHVDKVLRFDVEANLTSTRRISAFAEHWKSPKVIAALLSGVNSQALKEKLVLATTIIHVNRHTTPISAAAQETFVDVSGAAGVHCTMEKTPNTQPIAATTGKVEKEDRFVAKLAKTGFLKPSITTSDDVKTVLQTLPYGMKLPKEAVKAFCNGMWSKEVTDSADSDLLTAMRSSMDDSLESLTVLLASMSNLGALFRKVINPNHVARFESTWAYLGHVRDKLLQLQVSSDSIWDLLHTAFAELRNAAIVSLSPSVGPVYDSLQQTSRESLYLQDLLKQFPLDDGEESDDEDVKCVWGESFRTHVHVDELASKAYRERDNPTNSRTMTTANPIALANQLVAGFGAPRMWTRKLKGSCAMHLLAPGLCPKSEFCKYGHPSGQAWSQQQSDLDDLLGSSTVDTIRRRLASAVEFLSSAGKGGFDTKTQAAAAAGIK